MQGSPGIGIHDVGQHHRRNKNKIKRIDKKMKLRNSMTSAIGWYCHAKFMVHETNRKKTKKEKSQENPIEDSCGFCGSQRTRSNELLMSAKGALRISKNAPCWERINDHDTSTVRTRHRRCRAGAPVGSVGRAVSRVSVAIYSAEPVSSASMPVGVVTICALALLRSASPSSKASWRPRSGKRECTEMSTWSQIVT